MKGKNFVVSLVVILNASGVLASSHIDQELLMGLSNPKVQKEAGTFFSRLNGRVLYNVEKQDKQSHTLYTLTSAYDCE